MPLNDPRTLLQRVLLLERKQGFRDRAAIGGLTAFANAQGRRAEPADWPTVARVSAALAGYSDASATDRETAVTLALTALAQEPADSREHSAVVAPGGEPKRAKLLPRQKETAPAPTPIQRTAKPKQSLQLGSPLSELKGMRKDRLEAFSRVGVYTLQDLMYYFPRTHYDYTETRSISRLRLGQKTTLVGTIESVRTNYTARKISITTAVVADESGVIAVRWFNQPYLAKQLPIGSRIAVTGEPEVFNGSFTFQPRDYELIEETELTHARRLVPVYPLTKGLFQKSVRGLIRRVLTQYCDLLQEFLPSDLCSRLELVGLAGAVVDYHFPPNEESKARAEKRLAFDELLLVQLGLLRRKHEWQQDLPDVAMAVDEALDREFASSLPFRLTRAQQRVSAEILQDMALPRPMSRLVQGDVGSGKTVVAAAALLQMVRSGRQATLMAPTEILAEQHARTVGALLQPFGVRCELITGSVAKARRREVYADCASGSIDVLIGTHALIQEGVTFARLGLAVTDEQHRFGVEQRALLRQKGLHPHILSMTATPIPRSLAMTIYGDLDVSAIDEMPAGRTPVITSWFRTSVEAYAVVRRELLRGHQAFIVCPVIEESVDSDMRSVLAEHKELANLTFSDVEVGLLHGRMKSKEKEAALDEFRKGAYRILVATSVVEVGIDVPNATVMVIRDAHRFGLAQLHQFRGRVGRGADQAYCVLISDAETTEATDRLEALQATESGFELAEVDLRLRGPGEFWGTRQSGLPSLKVATLGDVATIQMAREAAQETLRKDPLLSLAEHALLCDRLDAFWSDVADGS